jgi:N-acetylmuramoyl-L-alanine amidase
VRRARIALGAIALALAGCGGSDSEVSVPTAEPTVAQVTTASTISGGAEGETTPAAVAAAQTVPRPAIVQWRIPFPTKRRAEMAAYSLRHYGEREWRLRDPHLIIEHWTQTPSVSATRDVFVSDKPDGELHELPGTCSHFVIARSGAIYQLVDLGTRCRHAFGMNWTAIGIEHVGYSDAEVMGNRRQLAASLALTRWLRCRYGIPTRDVIGHAETARSPYWREIKRKGRDTHDDMGPKAMRRYRATLARSPCP